MIECPHCHKPAMSHLKKACLGPALEATCKSCGKKVAVPYAAVLAVTPFLFSIFLANFLISYGWPVAAGALLLGFAAMAAIHAYLVPLVPRGA